MRTLGGRSRAAADRRRATIEVRVVASARDNIVQFSLQLITSAIYYVYMLATANLLRVGPTFKTTSRGGPAVWTSFGII